MLSVMPPKWILSQWRECLGVGGCLVVGLNHATVNRVKNYSIQHFVVYCDIVRKEMLHRGYTVGTNTIEKLNKDINFEEILKDVQVTDEKTVLVNDVPLFDEWHDFRYIRQCYYMMEEKYDCGMLSDEEMNKLKEFYASLTYDKI